jgi:hypothetical protein
MLDPKVPVVPAAEAPEEEILPEGDAPFKSTEEAPVEPEEESTEEVSDEAQAAADAIKPGEGEAAEETPEVSQEDEVDKILKEAEGTPNVQKRIDRLSAELKALKAENESLKVQKVPPGKRTYTDDELSIAMMKAVEEQDPNLMKQIIVEIKSGVKDEMVKMYTEEKQAGMKQAQAIDNEWKDVVDAYSKYADTKVPPIWPTSHKDLNIVDHTSMLYQIAMKLYWSNDPEKKEYYRQPGGQKLAVADALTYLMRTKAGKTTATKVKKLEKQLTKERMKKSPVSGGPAGETKASKAPATAEDTLAEVIAERKAYQEERGA